VALQGRKERKVFMRKALLIVAMLLLVTPVMATTTVKVLVNPAEQYSTGPDSNKVQPVSIAYVTDVNVRAFALDINSDNNNGSPNFQRIRNFKTGESNAASPGYGIFPSRFRDFIVVTGPNWVDTNYNPTTAWNEPGTTDHTWGMGFPKMIVEMGTLYAGDANKPAWSGTLFKFDVNSFGASGTFHITVAADALRGGVVGNDGNGISATFEGNDVYFAPQLCTVPTVVDQPEATATANIVGAGFTLGNRTATCSDTITTVGHIISTNPVGGSSVACGSAVDYVVSTGPCTCTVPTVVDQPEATATANIVGAGFTLGNRTTTCSNTITTVGHIISTTPGGGSSAACGSAVAYVVSTGSCTCTVPNVVTQPEATATGNIVAAGFTLGTRTTTCSNTIAAGSVISTNPVAGPAPCGSAVAYVVSTGPCICTVPTLTTCATANAAITAAGFVVGNVTTQNSSTVPAGTVISQSPLGGSSATCGSAVDYVCSLGLPAPASITYPPSDANNGIYNVSWASVTGATSYQLERNGGSGWSTIYTGSSTSYTEDVFPGSYTYRVKACNAIVGCGDYRTGTTCVVTFCYGTGDPNYANWIDPNIHRPTCWCYPRQCHGDADGKKTGSGLSGYMYVSQPDLDIMSAGWQIKDPPKGPGIANLTVSGVPVACGDFARNKTGSALAGYMRISQPDLDKMSLYWNVKEPAKGPGTPADCVPGNRNP
jgi:beta-lactam-binding protein with PASTA domain